MFESMALVTVDVGVGSAVPPGLEELTRAFRASGRPVVHAIGAGLADELMPGTGVALDDELLRSGGVQTLGLSEMALAMPSRGAFDATPLDAVLRSLGIETIVVGSPTPSPALSATIRGAELRGFRVLLATEELAVTLSPQLMSAVPAA